MGRQQTRQLGTDGSFQGGTSGGQAFSFGQQQSTGCFECVSQDHFKRDCPLLTQRTAPTPTHPVGQSSTRGSSSGTHVSSAARGGSHQGSGQRGCLMTGARLHSLTQQEGPTSPEVIIGTLLIFGLHLL